MWLGSRRELRVEELEGGWRRLGALRDVGWLGNPNPWVLACTPPNRAKGAACGSNLCLLEGDYELAVSDLKTISVAKECGNLSNIYYNDSLGISS